MTPLRQWYAAGAVLTVLLALFAWREVRAWSDAAVLGLFAGGAAANVPERLAEGVRDYICVGYFCPNLPDLAILAGACLVVAGCARRFREATARRALPRTGKRE